MTESKVQSTNFKDEPAAPSESSQIDVDKIHGVTNFGNVYAAIIQTRNTEATLYWNRYNILGAMVLGFTVAALNARPDTALFEYWPWVCRAGLALSFLWFVVAFTGRALVDYWENHVIALEKNPVNWKAFSHLNRSPRRSFYDRLVELAFLFTQPYTYVALSLPFLAIVGWSLLLGKSPLQPQMMEVEKRIDLVAQQVAASERLVLQRVQALESEWHSQKQGFASHGELSDLQRKFEEIDVLTQQCRGAANAAP